MGAVVVTYNVPGVEKGLKLTPEAPGRYLPGQDHQVERPEDRRRQPGREAARHGHRRGAPLRRQSGTTNIFTDYLSAVSPDWKSKVGKGTSVNWPVGLGAKGNEGVAGQVKQTPGSIGYVELAYAVAEQAALRLHEEPGGPVRGAHPGLDHGGGRRRGGQHARGPAGVHSQRPRREVLPDRRLHLHPGLQGADRTRPKGKALVDFLWWGIHDGESYARDLLYAPLPAEVVTRAEAKIKSITFQGKALYQ